MPQEEMRSQKTYYKKYNEQLMVGDNNPGSYMMPNFNQMNNRFNTYNNFPTNQQMMTSNVPKNIMQPSEGNEIEDEEEILAGDIYEQAEQYYPK